MKDKGFVMPIKNIPQNKRIKWTKQEEELLKTLYNANNSIEEISNKMNRSVNSIKKKAQQLNLHKIAKRQERKINIQDKLNLIVDYCKYRKTIPELRDKYRYSDQFIKHCLGEKVLSFKKKEKDMLKKRKLKRCSICLQVKNIDKFYQCQCKNCFNYKKNQYKKRYRKSMSKEQKEKQYKYYKQWKSNKIKVDPQYKEKLRKIKEESLERLKKNNPEKYLEYKSTNKLNNKLRNKNIPGSHTTEEWRELKKQLGDQCLCCRKTKEELESLYEENRSPLQRDHVVPISLGGTNYITNIQILCSECNNAKSNYVYDYRPKELRKYNEIDLSIIKSEIQNMKSIIKHLESLFD